MMHNAFLALEVEHIERISKRAEKVWRTYDLLTKELTSVWIPNTLNVRVTDTEAC